MIIIPDVHGRTFWKEALNHKDETIVFLGDYLDPYPFDMEHFFDDGGDYYECVNDMYRSVIDNFKEIIEFKKANPNVILLLGNHDCTYMFGTDVCNCRTDVRNYDEIRQLFIENRRLFQLTYTHKEGDEVYVMSHAGIHPEWFEHTLDHLEIWDAYKESEIGNILNDIYIKHFNDRIFRKSLGNLSSYRGGFGNIGSVVWADVNEWDFEKYDEYDSITQIVGHTQLRETGMVINLENHIYCVDSRKCFTLDEILSHKC